MGAWGVGPFSNDTACDWRDGELRAVIKHTVLTGSPDEIFAALTLVYHANLQWDYTPEEISEAFSRIESNDLEIGWRDLGKRQAAVNELKGLLLGGPAKEPGLMSLILSGE